MGGSQTSQNNSKEKLYISDSSSFFYKQMVTHTEITDIEKFYVLQDKIGQGTFATVYKSRSVLSGCVCSVKKVEKNRVPGIEQTLKNEFDILRGLDHPNIMKLYGFYEDSKHFYVVAELIKGKELFQYLMQRKVLEQQQAFEVFHQVLLCLNYLHKNNIMHRDIKLENMIYDPKSKILKLIDFGTACVFESREPGPYKCVGTASYIAPQVIKKRYNYKCDIWSLGAFLHILLAGSPPFPGKDQDEIFKAIQNNPPNLNHNVYSKLPDARNLISKLLQKQPQKRIKIEQIFLNPWFRKNLNKKIISNTDHQCILQIFKNLRKFSTLKLAEMQLGVLVLMVNFVVVFENEDSIIRCFHQIDVEGEGVITQIGLKTALVEFQDMPENKAKTEAATIMSKIDFNHSSNIDYSQFLVASSDLRKVITDQNLEKTFRLIDVDSSGKLSAGELKTTLGDQISQSYYKQIIRYFDADHDQQISLFEFKSMMKKLLQ